MFLFLISILECFNFTVSLYAIYDNKEDECTLLLFVTEDFIDSFDIKILNQSLSKSEYLTSFNNITGNMMDSYLLKIKMDKEKIQCDSLLQCASKIPCYGTSPKKIVFIHRKTSVKIIKEVGIDLIVSNSNMKITHLLFDVFLLQELILKNSIQINLTVDTEIKNGLQKLVSIFYEETIKNEMMSDMLNLQNNFIRLNKKMAISLKKFGDWQVEYLINYIENIPEDDNKNTLQYFLYFHGLFTDYFSMREHYNNTLKKLSIDIEDRKMLEVKNRYLSKTIISLKDFP
ncbi:hypothetical protein P3W45_001664 [Vairimorpha bombi]|jgi:hypothetical protein